jgi:hypothetical protein
VRIEDEVLNALVQVFTRARTPQVLLNVSDSLPLPPFSLAISIVDFSSYLERAELSVLSITSLVDLLSLYPRELETVLTREFNRRKSTEPDFPERLAAVVTPRLRDPANPDWRFPGKR